MNNFTCLQFASSVDVSGFHGASYVPLIRTKHFHREYFKENIVGHHRLSFYCRKRLVPDDRSGLKSTLTKTLPISSCVDPNSAFDARHATATLDERARNGRSFLMARDIPIPSNKSFIKLSEYNLLSDMLVYSMKPTPGNKHIIFLYKNKIFLTYLYIN